MTTTRTTIAVLLGLVACLWLLPSCEDSSRTGSDGDDDDGTADGDDDNDDDTPSDDPQWADLSGTVLAPAGTFPISGALVYVTQSDPPVIPPNAYCYECEDMTGKKWTLSGADGGFTLPDVAPGTWTLVTRKGFFQRARSITVGADATMAVPPELTTLPGDASTDGLDQIPRYAVLLNEWDASQDLLAKLGMGEVGPAGHLIWGTETFTAFNDAVTHTGYPASAELFASQETLNSYHMAFFPCTSDANAISFIKNHAEMLREYVSAGGKIYNSCCTAIWTEAPFSEYIDFNGGQGSADPTDVRDIGRISSSAYSTNGQVNDQFLADWLSVVVPGSDPAHFPFANGYVKIDALVELDDGHGLEADNGVVRPKDWVTDNNAYPGSPLMVTYNFDCGKVFFSVYETSHGDSPGLTPQEYVLLYLILEVGVCEGTYVQE